MSTATHARQQMLSLTAERLDAREAGLAGNAAYMADLEADIADCRDAYVGAAVTEIACLRARLTTPLHG